MTISTTTSKVSYTGNGVTDAFAYTFKIFADSEVTVYVDNVLKTLTTHYTVSGAGTASGGNVTFTAGNIPASSTSVVLLRNITKTQLTDYVENDSFPAETHESALDKLTMLVQDVDNAVTGDIFRFADSVGDAGVVTITKTAAERASKVLAFDTSGDLQADQEIGTFKGNWAASTAYGIRDLIKDNSNNNIYICNAVHTSSGSQPISGNTDVAKWNLIVDAAAATTSATSASSSASTATTQAGIATTQAGIATAKAVLTASDATDTAADLVETAADVVLAEAAKVSAEAATGASAFKFTFDNSTSMADPSAGELRLNHGTVASVTAITFDAVSADTSNPDVSDYIASWDDGSNSTHEGYITIRKSGTPATYAVFSLTGAVTDNTGYLTAVVTHVDSNGTWSDADTMYVSFARSGDKGATGSTGSTGSTGATGATGAGSSGFHYQFETATADSDQGAGKIWLNHATVASATVLYIDDDDNDGTDISAFTATWDDSSATADKGFIKIQSRATATDYAVFKISSSGTDGTAYWKFPVTHLVSAGTFSDTEVVDVFFTRSGDSGGVANRTVDTMTGDGSDDTLTLSQDPANENNVTITLDGVTQHHDTFSLSGTTVTFSTAPALGVKVEAVSGGRENIGTPSDNTVTLAKMQANSIDSDQYVDGSIDNVHLAANSVDSDNYVDGSIDLVHLSATGTAGSGNFLRGDNSWQTAGGSSLGSGMIRTNLLAISSPVTFAGTENGVTYGPISVTALVTVTSPSVWHIL